MMSRFPDKIKLKLDSPCYTGSVQKLYDVPDHPELIISETTAGGSVFDVGTIFNIEGSDVGRASFRHLVFQQMQDPESWEKLSGTLSDSGLTGKNAGGIIEKTLSIFKHQGASTHHVGMLDRGTGEVFAKGFPPQLSNLTLIKKYTVLKPELKKVLGWHFYDYKKYHSEDGFVIPLEYIVRLGITSGSSILRKYNALSEPNKKVYLSELGLNRPLSPWTRFDTPLVDLTTKYEPEDRNISRQEAALISSLDGETFSRSMVMAILGAFMLQQIFSRMGLYLWDLKWEIAKDGDDLVFVDTIDTDSVRVTMNIIDNDKSYFVHFNKQVMRDYYKIMHADWLNAVNEAKKLAARTGRPFTDILSEGQGKGNYPANPDIDRTFLDLQKQKFELIQYFIQNQEKDMSIEAEKIAKEELDYYFSQGHREQYEALNAV
jgi:phosphoribosylaminoimidazole-succinocarboxamide synthase